MKLASPQSSRLSGFTLVELLVVIGIIAILAAVVISGAGSAINAAKRMKTLAAGNQLVTAVQNYYTEYSFYPAPANTAVDTYYDSKNATAYKWGDMMVALCGGVDPGNPGAGQYSATPTIPNTRQISYLSPNRGDLDTTVKPAILKTPFTSSAGATQYYFMAVDTDYDNVLGSPTDGIVIPDFSKAKANTVLPQSQGITAGVAVWSNCDQNPSLTVATNPNFWVHTY